MPVRIGTPEEFEELTGGRGSVYIHPAIAFKRLLDRLEPQEAIRTTLAPETPDPRPNRS
jgi:hypothetical protein